METPIVTEQTPLLHSVNAEHPINVINTSNDNHPNQSNSIGFFAAVFLTVNATLGAGLLNIPYSFVEFGGIFIATFVQIVSESL